ncbi:hypothetical protein EVA_22077, partial [gut metagenome]
IVVPGFNDYAIGVQTSTNADGSPVTERLIAHITTSERLDGHDRETAERLVRLDVPDVDSVTFSVLDEED